MLCQDFEDRLQVMFEAKFNEVINISATYNNTQLDKSGSTLHVQEHLINNFRKDLQDFIEKYSNFLQIKEEGYAEKEKMRADIKILDEKICLLKKELCDFRLNIDENLAEYIHNRGDENLTSKINPAHSGPRMHICGNLLVVFNIYMIKCSLMVQMKDNEKMIFF